MIKQVVILYIRIILWRYFIKINFYAMAYALAHWTQSSKLLGVLTTPNSYGFPSSHTTPLAFYRQLEGSDYPLLGKDDELRGN